MSTEILVRDKIDLQAIEFKLKSKTTKQLRADIPKYVAGGAEMLAKAAVCVKIILDRGEQPPDIPGISILKRIAYGQLLPELAWVSAASGNRRTLESLPLTDQRRIIEDPMVKVVEPRSGPGGGYTTRMVNILEAPPNVAKLAVNYDGIRTTEEQIAYLAAQKADPANAPKAAKSDDDVAREPFQHSIKIKLTPSEFEAIKVRAARARKKEWQYIHDSLAKAGAFKASRV